MLKEINSVQNKLIKDLILYKEKGRARRQAKKFLIEGQREIQLALDGGYELELLLIQEELVSEEFLRKVENKVNELISVSSEVYERLAYRGGTEGIIGIARFKEHHLSNLNFKTEKPLILVAEAPEKPGNIGALLRTADAANLDAVIIANPISDLYNPNIVRSSVGCLFTNQIAVGSTNEIIEYLKENDINIYSAILQEAQPYNLQDYTKATAIVVGTEDKGLSEEWRKQSTQNIIIPMEGVIDSMNVSVAAGILIFEAKRQRGFVWALL